MSEVKDTPWTCETVQSREDRSAYAVVKDAKGRVLFDSLNSDVAEIHEEYDEHATTRWDETGRVNLTLAASAPGLLAFKQYVHARLDAAGVSADPDSPHKAEGCRIGGRLDELVGERDRLRAACSAMLDRLAEYDTDDIDFGRSFANWNELATIRSLVAEVKAA